MKVKGKNNSKRITITNSFDKLNHKKKAKKIKTALNVLSAAHHHFQFEIISNI